MPKALNWRKSHLMMLIIDVHETETIGWFCSNSERNTWTIVFISVFYKKVTKVYTTKPRKTKSQYNNTTQMNRKNSIAIRKLYIYLNCARS